MRVSTELGERIRDSFRCHVGYTEPFSIGFVIRPVTFADRRAGWSAIRLEINLGWWIWRLYPLQWRTKPMGPVVAISLATQLRWEHGDVKAE